MQNGREHAEFDREHDRLSVWLPKARPGEHFDGLDMLTRLLARPKELPGSIEELDSPQQQQQQEIHEASSSNLVYPHYGFGNGFSRFFEPLQEDLPEIVDIPQPDLVPACDRRRLREQHEDQHFEIEHYMFGHPHPTRAAEQQSTTKNTQRTEQTW